MRNYFIFILLVLAGCGQQEPAGNNYVGSKSCKECHERFYNLWSPSHHGKAMQPYTDELAADYLVAQSEAIDIDGIKYLADISAGKGFITETGPDGSRQYKIEHAMGGKNVFFFLTMLEGGRFQVMPISYDVNTKLWYDTTASMVRHFDLEEDEAVHWTDSLLTFNTACFNCHVSQLRKNYDLASDTYNTVWGEPGINCETCHGPCGEHNRTFQKAKGKKKQPDDLKLLDWKTLSPDQKNASCSGCHAKAAPITAAFEPGDKFFDHYDLTCLEDHDFYADGRDLGENYTLTGWMMSPCVKSSKLDCVDCHTSSGRYRFKTENPNGACLPCHKERVENVAAHSHHPAQNKKSPTCVGCHMPLTNFGRMDRSDHSMRPPSPAASIKFKSPNSCNMCHADKDNAWAAEKVKAWHPKEEWTKKILREGQLVQWARDRKWENLPAIYKYLQEKESDDIVITSLVRMLGQCNDMGKLPILREMLKHPSPLVRASSAVSLGAFDMASIHAILPLLNDEYKLVRIRAANTLLPQRGLIPQEYRQRFVEVEKELVESITCRPDHWASHYNFGIYQGHLGLTEKAIESYELAIKMRDDVALPYVNVSIVLAQMGDSEKAYQYLKKAYELEPKSGAVNLNLGMLMAERGDLVSAEKHFRVSLEEDGTMPQSAFNLAVIVGAKDPAQAVEFCKKALEGDPQNQKYRQALGYYMNIMKK